MSLPAAGRPHRREGRNHWSLRQEPLKNLHGSGSSFQSRVWRTFICWLHRSFHGPAREPFTDPQADSEASNIQLHKCGDVNEEKSVRIFGDL